MFQFPGFALKTLCIQVLSTCFTRLLIADRSIRGLNGANNNWMSGGFPHSEIQGSKPITGSPWLIAGYHVLHRLLLPRHPPNALLALDLIQEKTGFSRSKAVLYPHRRWFVAGALVSVLDLDSYVSCRRVRRPSGRLPHTRASQHETDVYLSIRCQSPRISEGNLRIVRLDGETQISLRFTIQSWRVWWSVAGSNR